MNETGINNDSFDLKSIEEDFNALYKLKLSTNKKKGFGSMQFFEERKSQNSKKVFLDMNHETYLLNDFLDEEERILLGPNDINIPIKNNSRISQKIKYDDKSIDRITSSIKYDKSKKTRPSQWNLREIRPKIYDEFIEKRNSILRSSNKKSVISTNSNQKSTSSVYRAISSAEPNDLVKISKIEKHYTPSTECGTSSRIANGFNSNSNNVFRYGKRNCLMNQQTVRDSKKDDYSILISSNKTHKNRDNKAQVHKELKVLNELFPAKRLDIGDRLINKINNKYIRSNNNNTSNNKSVSKKSWNCGDLVESYLEKLQGDYKSDISIKKSHQDIGWGFDH